MKTFSVSEARAHLRTVLDHVRRGEDVTITQNGEPVAVVVSPSALRFRRLDPKVQEKMAVLEAIEADGSAWPPERGLTGRRADELVADVRAGRDAR